MKFDREQIKKAEDRLIAALRQEFFANDIIRDNMMIFLWGETFREIPLRIPSLHLRACSIARREVDEAYKELESAYGGYTVLPLSEFDVTQKEAL